MRLEQVDGAAVRAAVDRRTDSFGAGDVAADPKVRKAHGVLAQQRNYPMIIDAYLNAYHETLGLVLQGSASPDVGRRWIRRPAAGTPPFDRSSVLLAGAPARVVAGPVTNFTEPRPSFPTPRVLLRPIEQARGGPHQAWYRCKSVFFVLIPVISVGLGAFVPAIWAAQRPRTGTRLPSRAILYRNAVVLGAMAVLGFALIVSAPTDATGAATGARSNLGTVIILLTIILGTVYAARLRRPCFASPDAATPHVPGPEQTPLPGVAEALARRALRDRYRKLAAEDPGLAGQLRIGRPDLPRDIDDGGLLDLNQLDVASFVTHAGLTESEAQDVVAARARLGGEFSNLDELTVVTQLPAPKLNELRERALLTAPTFP